MDSILALFNIMILSDFTDEECEQLLGLNSNTNNSRDKLERIMSVGGRVEEQYTRLLNIQLDAVSRTTVSLECYQLAVIQQLYQTLSRMASDTQDNPNCLPLANIVLVGTPTNAVPLNIIHAVNHVIKAHNQLGHPTKVQLVVTNLSEMVIL